MKSAGCCCCAAAPLRTADAESSPHRDLANHERQRLSFPIANACAAAGVAESLHQRLQRKRRRRLERTIQTRAARKVAVVAVAAAAADEQMQQQGRNSNGHARKGVWTGASLRRMLQFALNRQQQSMPAATIANCERDPEKSAEKRRVGVRICSQQPARTETARSKQLKLLERTRRGRTRRRCAATQRTKTPKRICDASIHLLHLLLLILLSFALDSGRGVRLATTPQTRCCCPFCR